MALPAVRNLQSIPNNEVDLVGDDKQVARPWYDWLLRIDLLVRPITHSNLLANNYANDAAAAAGGIPIGGLYRNGSVIQIRVV